MQHLRGANHTFPQVHQRGSRASAWWCAEVLLQGKRGNVKKAPNLHFLRWSSWVLYSGADTHLLNFHTMTHKASSPTSNVEMDTWLHPIQASLMNRGSLRRVHLYQFSVSLKVCWGCPKYFHLQRLTKELSPPIWDFFFFYILHIVISAGYHAKEIYFSGRALFKGTSCDGRDILHLYFPTRSSPRNRATEHLEWG